MPCAPSVDTKSRILNTFKFTWVRPQFLSPPSRFLITGRTDDSSLIANPCWPCQEFWLSAIDSLRCVLGHVWEAASMRWVHVEDVRSLRQRLRRWDEPSHPSVWLDQTGKKKKKVLRRGFKETSQWLALSPGPGLSNRLQLFLLFGFLLCL